MALRSEAERNKHIFEQWALKGPVVDKDKVFDRAKTLFTYASTLPDRLRQKLGDLAQACTENEETTLPTGSRTKAVLVQLVSAFEAADVPTQRLLSDKIEHLLPVVEALETIRQSYLGVRLSPDTVDKIVDGYETDFLSTDTKKSTKARQTIFSLRDDLIRVKPVTK